MTTLTSAPTQLLVPPPTSTAKSSGAFAFDRQRPTPFVRLTRTELRKMGNTRSGKTLFVIMAAMTIAIPIMQLIFLQNDLTRTATFDSFIFGAQSGIQLVLPIMAILLITSEWTQRSALTTFTLTPDRKRIVAAKLTTVIVATLAMCAAVLAVAAIANLASTTVGNPSVVWDLSAADGVVFVVSNALPVLTGFALGMVLLNSAGAIVAYFIAIMLLPSLLAALSLVSWLEPLATWIDPTTTLAAVSAEPTVANHWAHLVVANLVWIGIPLVAGAYRIVRTEIK